MKFMTEENSGYVAEIGDFVSTPVGESYRYHQWFKNFWDSNTTWQNLDQDLKKWNGKFLRSMDREFIMFKSASDYTMFLLRWS